MVTIIVTFFRKKLWILPYLLSSLSMSDKDNHNNNGKSWHICCYLYALAMRGQVFLLFFIYFLYVCIHIYVCVYMYSVGGNIFVTK